VKMVLVEVVERCQEDSRGRNEISCCGTVVGLFARVRTTRSLIFRSGRGEALRKVRCEGVGEVVHSEDFSAIYNSVIAGVNLPNSAPQILVDPNLHSQLAPA
jgi:hypothetical protein